MNIARPENYPITLVVEIIERYLNKKRNYDILEKGTASRIDTEPIVPILKTLSLLRKDRTLDMALLSYLVHKENLSYSLPPTISHHTSFLADNSDFPRIIMNWDKNGFGCKRPLVHLLKPTYGWSFLKRKIRPQ